MATLAVVFAPTGKLEVKQQHLPAGASFVTIAVDQLPKSRVEISKLATRLGMELLNMIVVGAHGDLPER